MKQPNEARPLRPLPSLIFASRWLQLPLYFGLIAAQAICPTSPSTFINAVSYDERTSIAQVSIPITFLLSAMAVAAADRIIPQAPHA